MSVILYFSGLGKQAGHWRPQASWSLEFSVVGKENASARDCSSYEKKEQEGVYEGQKAKMGQANFPAVYS